MVRSFAVITAILLLLTIEHAKASSCAELADSKDRLACYDNAALCQAETSDVKRLACFDRAFDQAPPMPQNVPTSVSSTVEPADPAVPPPRAPIYSSTNTAEKVAKKPQAVYSEPVSSEDSESKVNESEFGLPDRRLAEDAKFIEATIVRVQTNSNRIDYLKLDNGQVWREVEDGRLRFKVGQRVRIESGLLSSYKLKVVGKNLSVKVKRTK